MKILFEVAPTIDPASNGKEQRNEPETRPVIHDTTTPNANCLSEFTWLPDDKYHTNRLFLIERGKKIRTLATDQDQEHTNLQARRSASNQDQRRHAPEAKELQSALLAEPKRCTSLSWNRDGTILGLVIDRFEVYFWLVSANKFTNFRPSMAGAMVGNSSSSKKLKSKEINLIAWSLVSERLLICLSTGQLLIAQCDKFGNVKPEKLIDNSDGLLKRAQLVECSQQVDLFACVSIANELLVMSFDGQMYLYIEAGEFSVGWMKFSPPFKDLRGSVLARVPALKYGELHVPQTTSNLIRCVWLARRPSRPSNKILFTKIALQEAHHATQLRSPGAPTMGLGGSQPERDGTGTIEDESELGEGSNNQFETPGEGIETRRVSICSPTTAVGQETNSSESSDQVPGERLVDFHWLDGSNVIACLAHGALVLIRLNSNAALFSRLKQRSAPGAQVQAELVDDSTQAQIEELFDVWSSSPLAEEDSDEQGTPTAEPRAREPLIGFDLRTVSADDDGHLGVALLSRQRIVYCELFRDDSAIDNFRMERVDEVDLEVDLERAGARLECGCLSRDSSLLAVRLSNQHLIVYRTRLSHQLVARAGPRVAYLSELGEVSLLNYASEVSTDEESQQPSSSPRADDLANDSDLSMPHKTIELSFLRPSLLAVGPFHLAAVLNNRVHLYDETSNLADEREYVSNVIGLSLSGRFAAVQLADGRLKLHPISRPNAGRPGEAASQDSWAGNERYFPDPSRPERITAFALTERLLILEVLPEVATAGAGSGRARRPNLQVFALDDWDFVRTFDGRSFDDETVAERLCPNLVGNKLVLLTSAPRANAHLYDLNTNSLVSFSEQETLAAAANATAAAAAAAQKGPPSFEQLLAGQLDEHLLREAPEPKLRQPLGKLEDALWDTDGRCVWLVERHCSVHSFVLLDHTFGSPTRTRLHFVSTTQKPSNCRVLYASQGILSFQTSLGRVVNCLAESHDDELQLARLAQQLATIGRNNAGQLQRRQTLPNSRQRLECEVQKTCLRLAYLRSILPLNPFGKCREIAEHITESEFDQDTNCSNNNNANYNASATNNDHEFEHNDSPLGENANYDEGHEDNELASYGAREDGPTARQVRQLHRSLWRALATWALYTMNLADALHVYRKQGMLVEAHVLNEIITDARARGLDSRRAVEMRLLILLGCEELLGSGEGE